MELPKDCDHCDSNDEVKNITVAQLPSAYVLSKETKTSEGQLCDDACEMLSTSEDIINPEITVSHLNDPCNSCNLTVVEFPEALPSPENSNLPISEISCVPVLVEEECRKLESTESFVEEQQNSTEHDDSCMFQSVGSSSALNEKSVLETECNTVGQNEVVDYTVPKYMFSCEPQLITGVWQEFKKNTDECFTKGCKWSPDGTCILTNSEDSILRIFDLPRELHCQESWPEGRSLPEMKSSLQIKEGGRIYDYCWYPFMSSWNPLSCCLVSTSQFSPVHLWDAYSGQLRATYRSYNQVDEIDHAFSVAFNLTGEKLYCGFKKRLSVFNTACPGSACENRSLKSLGRPVGIVSCICVNPANENIYAFSSYSRTIGLCAEPDGNVVCLLCNEGGGLTHIMFSPDGTRLYAGSRNDSQLFCWDLRNLGKILFTAERINNTNQRIYFDLTPDGRFLVSGSTNGLVHVWDTLQSPEDSGDVPFLPVKTTIRAHNDCVNGLSLHKQYPIMATSSGQRHPYCPDCDSDEESLPQSKKRHVHPEDTVKLWWMGPIGTPVNASLS